MLSRLCSQLKAVKCSVWCTTHILYTTQSPVYIQISLYMSVLQHMCLWDYCIGVAYATIRRLTSKSLPNCGNHFYCGLRDRDPTTTLSCLTGSRNGRTGECTFVALVGHTFSSLAALSYPQSKPHCCKKASGLSLAFEKLGIESRGRAKPAPWLTPPRTEARLLDSDVQELFGAEDLGAYDLASVTQTEFLGVMRLFGLICCEITLTAVARGDVRSGTGHLTVFCGVCFIKISAEFESRRKIVAEVPGELI